MSDLPARLLRDKEENQEKDAANKCNADCKQDASGFGDPSHKHAKREIFCYCKTDGYEV